MVALKKITDKQLVDNYIQGHEASLNDIVTRLQPRLLNYIYQIVKDNDLANDIFQDTFFKFIEAAKSGNYKQTANLFNYLSRIAYNLCMNHFREIKRVRKVNPKDDLCVFRTLRVNNDSSLETIMQSQSYRMLRKLFNKLNEKHKEILYLRLYQNYSFKEIAEMKNISIGSSLGTYRYAIAAMQDLAIQNRMMFAMY